MLLPRDQLVMAMTVLWSQAWLQLSPLKVAYCPSNDKDDSDSESSFDSSQYDDFGPPSDNDKEGYLCFGSPPSSEDMDVFLTKFTPLSEGASSTLASVSNTSHAPPVQTLYDNDCC
jgi:hypothetical protein